MKKALSLVLAFVMMLAVIHPISAGATDPMVSISVSPESIDFGTHYTNFVGENEVVKTVTITNTGNVAITVKVQSPYNYGPFGIYWYDSTQVIEPESSVDVRFRAAVGLSYSGIAGTYNYSYVITATQADGELTAQKNVDVSLTLVEPVYYTVSFKTYGGTAIDSQSVLEGSKAEKPADPARQNSAFAGWYKDEGFTEAFDFESEKINADTPLYAKWEDAVTYTVDFNSNGGTAFDSQITVSGSKAANPGNPQKDGYTFMGWYSDEGLTQAFDFDSNTIEADTTLYAKWKAVEVKIELSRSETDFGRYIIPLGDSVYADAVVITNTGDVGVTINVNAPYNDGPFAVRWYDDSAVIEPGETMDICPILSSSSGFASSPATYTGKYAFTATQADGTASYTAYMDVKAELHRHELTHVYAQEPTCTQNGNNEYYYCEGCGTYFKDAEAGTETTLKAETIAKLGHAYNAKGVCTRCYDWKYKTGKPKLVSVTNVKNGITVKWSAFTGAEGYFVYRKAPGDTKWKLIASGMSDTSYTDTKVKTGTKYTYTIKAYNRGTESKYNTSGLTILRLANPSVKLANTTAGVKVSWAKVTGAKGYYVYRKSGSEGYKKIATTANLSYVDKTAKAGTKYTYTVKAYNGSYASAYTGVVIIRLTNPSVKLTNTKKGPKATWGKVTGAKGYIIYRKTSSGSYSKIATTTSLSYVDKTAKKNVKYYYAVRAYNGSYKSAYTNKGITCKK